jgi:RimJ/RimL family protein N-acetyltransferase
MRADQRGTGSASSAWPYRVCMADLPLPTPPLADDAIALRPWRETDIPVQLRIFSDPVFQASSDWAPRTEADARRALVEYEAARQRGEQAEFALVASHDDDMVLGGGSLNNITLTQGRAAIGYWLAPEARGSGAAARAVRLLARWAFEDLGIARLELTCGPDNIASQRVAERCGFTREGVLRSHMPFKGGRRDTVMFSLLPGELR